MNTVTRRRHPARRAAVSPSRSTRRSCSLGMPRSSPNSWRGVGFDRGRAHFDCRPRSGGSGFAPACGAGRRWRRSSRWRYGPEPPRRPNAGGERARRGRCPRELIERAVAAKGGVDVLRSIRTSRVQATTVVRSEGAPTEFPSTTYIRYPGAFRNEAQLPGGRLVQVFSAGTAWFEDAAGVHDAPPAMLDQMRGAVQRDFGTAAPRADRRQARGEKAR